MRKPLIRSGSPLSEESNAQLSAIAQPGSKSTVRYLLRVLVALCFLALIFYNIPVTTVLDAFDQVDIGPLCLAFGTALSVQYLCAMRLRILSDSQRLGLTTWQLLEINLATRFYGLFLLGGNITALAIRLYKMTRQRLNLPGAAVALLADRMVATVLLCFTGVVFGLLSGTAVQMLWLLLLGATGLALAVVSLLLLQWPILPRWRPHGRRGRKAIQKLGALHRALQESRSIGARGLVQLCLLSVLANLVGSCGYWLVADATGLSLSLVAVGWLRAVMLFVTLVPISTAGIGVREAGAVLVLQAFGVDAAAAVAFSLLAFGTSIVATGLLGGVLEAVRFAYSGRLR